MLDAGPDLVAVTRLALEARERTGGRSTRPSTTRSSPPATTAPSTRSLPDGAAAQPASACGGEVRIDGRRIELEPGFRLDLGGIAQGLRRRPRRATARRRPGPASSTRAATSPARGRLWPVGVETADGELTLELDSGALATSGRDRRRWQRDGAEAAPPDRPRDREPADGDFLRVTVLAPTAVEAEVLAKAVFLGAPRPDTPAVLVTTDGRTRA